MAINTGVKGTLAKLLATEDLVVEHRKCETAQFDVERRVLTLPIWEKASETVYDLLVSHEVGHALFTPREWQIPCPQSFINVVEDARVEKLMKRKYQGLPKTFYGGYKELNDSDFFGIEGNVSKFTLIDRINLFYKIGSFTYIGFNDDEQYFCDRVGKCETFEDVCLAARDIFRYMKAQFEEDENEAPDDVPTFDDLPQPQAESIENEGIDQESDIDDPDYSEPEQQEVSAGVDEVTESDGTEGSDHHEPLESLTDKVFTDKIKEYVQTGGYDTEYVEIPNIDPDTLTVGWKEVLATAEDTWTSIANETREYHQFEIEELRRSTEEYKEFYKQSQKEVNYLVKEFECRKSASAYARATTSRTGVLDTAKLHTYKFNEDLFKKVTNIPEGKNHGMLFLLDWSGSMSNCLFDTVKQVLQLCWFCKKTQIPFRVYAFTHNLSGFRGFEPKDEEDRVMGNVAFDNGFGLLEMLSSDATTKEYDRLALTLWRNAGANSYAPRSWGRNYNFRAAAGFSLSGTPLLEALAAMQSIVPRFQKQTGVQKLSLSILTDGESAPCQYYVKRENLFGGRSYANSFSQHCQLRDRKTGKVYPKKSNPMEHVNIFVESLKDRYPYLKVLGFRLIPPRDVKPYFRLTGYMGYHKQHWEDAVKSYRKHKVYEFVDSPYDKLWVLPAQTLESEDTFSELKEDATKAQVGAAFKKMFKAKGNNKRMLTSFSETIA